MNNNTEGPSSEILLNTLLREGFLTEQEYTKKLEELRASDQPEVLMEEEQPKYNIDEMIEELEKQAELSKDTNVKQIFEEQERLVKNLIENIINEAKKMVEKKKDALIEKIKKDAADEVKETARSRQYTPKRVDRNDDSKPSSSSDEIMTVDYLLFLSNEIIVQTECSKAEQIYNEMKRKISILDSKEHNMYSFLDSVKESPNYTLALFCCAIFSRSILMDNHKTISFCTNLLEIQTSEHNLLVCLTHYIRGCCYVDLKRYSEAKMDFGKIIEDYDYYKAYVSRSLILQRSDQVEAALNDLNIGIENHPNIAMLYKCRADLYKNSLDDWESALRDYNHAIILSPDYFAAFLSRAQLFFKISEFDMALADYNRALKIQASSVPCLVGRGKVFEVGFKNFESARLDYILALKLDPKNLEAKDNLQRIEKIFKDVKKEKPAQKSHTHILDILVSKSKEIRNSRSLNDSFKIYLTIIDVLELQSHSITEKLIENMVEANINTTTEDESMLIRVLYNRIIKKDYENCLSDLDSIIHDMDDSCRPFKALTHFIRALCYEDMQNYQQALKDYSLITDKYDSKSVHVFLNRANLYCYKLKDHKTGLSIINQAIANDPSNAVLFNMRGRIYETCMEDLEAARFDFETAIKIDNCYTSAKNNLKRIVDKLSQK
ncbi:predicted protein [Naegleria gruberi]|uniref:Predicted protein n=1 Tax=Naegleria gruberi TaxID=5762 RepID=D2V3B8_NAEGR|nr:uncharacterized protein NAEGRDRAFT_46364 [Naegleria gruberi]EFC48743.1 predicted protein [Naegleria gruberi]|eukprot:XP_002681487.1 predicted protein [Naegleria gruberi strain NEG-M]